MAAQIVAHYQRRTTVETAFRTLKSVSLRVRAIHHRRENRVISHAILYILSYYVEYHLRKVLAPMFWAEENPEGKRAQRKNAIEPAKRSEHTKKTVRIRRTAEGHAARKYVQLMEHRSGLCRTILRPKIAMQKNHHAAPADAYPTAGV